MCLHGTDVGRSSSCESPSVAQVHSQPGNVLEARNHMPVK